MRGFNLAGSYFSVRFLGFFSGLLIIRSGAELLQWCCRKPPRVRYFYGYSLQQGSAIISILSFLTAWKKQLERSV